MRTVGMAQASDSARTLRLVGLLAAMLLALAAAMTLGAERAWAAPGDRVYATSDPVTVTVETGSTIYTSQIGVYTASTPPTLITTVAASSANGQTFNLGTFTPGTELVFGISLTNSGGAVTYFTGPASRNPDNVIHANVTSTGYRALDITFEDEHTGGDLDFDDVILHVAGVTGRDTQAPVLEYRFNPTTRGVEVQAFDQGEADLVTEGPIGPTSCTTQRTGQTCTYRAVDTQGNSTTMTLQITQSGNQTRVRVVSVQQSGKPVVTPLTNEMVYDYTYSGMTLTSLTQNATVTDPGPPASTQQVRATWTQASMQTVVTPVKPASMSFTTNAMVRFIVFVEPSGRLQIDTGII